MNTGNSQKKNEQKWNEKNTWSPNFHQEVPISWKSFILWIDFITIIVLLCVDGNPFRQLWLADLIKQHTTEGSRDTPQISGCFWGKKDESIQLYTVPETNSKNTWKWMVGRTSFLLGWPIFRSPNHQFYNWINSQKCWIPHPEFLTIRQIDSETPYVAIVLLHSYCGPVQFHVSHLFSDCAHKLATVIDSILMRRQSLPRYHYLTSWLVNYLKFLRTNFWTHLYLPTGRRSISLKRPQQGEKNCRTVNCSVPSRKRIIPPSNHVTNLGVDLKIEGPIF